MLTVKVSESLCASGQDAVHELGFEGLDNEEDRQDGIAIE